MHNEKLKTSKFKNKCKIWNFEVHVEFANKDVNKDVADVLTLMILSVNTSFENNIKYINLCINTYTDTNVEESFIPNIKTIKICRYDDYGNIFLTTVYNNCTFICNEVKHNYYDNNLPEFHVVYKFTYDNMIIEPNNGGIKNG